jgi:hypothetical protein
VNQPMPTTDRRDAYEGALADGAPVNSTALPV